MPLPILAAIALQQGVRYGARKVAAYTGRKLLGRTGRKIADKTGMALNEYGQPALHGYFVVDAIKEAQKGNTAALDLMSLSRIPGAGKVLSRLPGLGRKTELGKKLEKGYEKYGGGIQTTGRMGGPGMGLDTHIAADFKVLQGTKTKSGKPTETAVLVQKTKVDKSHPVFERGGKAGEREAFNYKHYEKTSAKQRREEAERVIEKFEYLPGSIKTGGDLKGFNVIVKRDSKGRPTLYGLREPVYRSGYKEKKTKDVWIGHERLSQAERRRENKKLLAHDKSKSEWKYERRPRKKEDITREEGEIREEMSRHVDEIIKKGDPVNRLFASKTEADQKVASIFLQEARKKGLKYSHDPKGANRIVEQNPKIYKEMLASYKKKQPPHIFQNIWGSQKEVKPTSTTLLREDVTYVFAGNVKGLGGGPKSGQAVIRGHKTAYQIPSKKSPYEFWSDKNYAQNIKHIDEAIAKIPRDKPIVISSGGIGTGRANLEKAAPKTFDYLQKSLKKAGLHPDKLGPNVTKVDKFPTPKPKTQHESTRDFVLSQEVAQRAMYQQFRSAKSTVKLDGRKAWSSPGRSILITTKSVRPKIDKTKGYDPTITWMPTTSQMKKDHHWYQWMTKKLDNQRAVTNVKTRGKYAERKDPEVTEVKLTTRIENQVNTYKVRIGPKIPKYRYDPKNKTFYSKLDLPPQYKATGWERTYGKTTFITIGGKKFKIGPMRPAEMGTVVERGKQLKIKLKQGDLPKSSKLRESTSNKKPKK